jgi:general secretion pathway protein A
VKELLQQAKSLNKQFVLIIDEAHLLSDQALEEIRLLSNIETEDQKLLQILLVGQYELSYKLDRPQMRHLRQRININRFLSPMNSYETRQYVDHRLRQVGSGFAIVFDDNCASAIYKMTGGVPRNINQLCDNALLICMSETQRKINRKILRKAQEALLTDRLFTPPKIAQIASAPRRKLPRFLVWTGVGVTFLALVIDLSQPSFLGRLGQQLSRQVFYLTGRVPDSKEALPSESIKDKILIIPGQEPSSQDVSPKSETSQNSAITPAVAPAVSTGTPGPANLPPSSQPEAGESAAAPPTVLASIKEGPEEGPVPGKTASPVLSSPAVQPPNVAEPPAPQVKESNAPSGAPLKPAFLRREVKKGETLSIIASQAYRGSEEFSIEAVILDNPGIKDRDLIYPGQTVYLPRINPGRQTMQLRDNLFYAYYGRYDSTDTMKGVSALLEQKGVRYTIIANDGRRGSSSHHILLGGYEKVADLQKALDLAKAYKN